jgi:glycosyltransferase involved in cell wall biosynthesis
MATAPVVLTVSGTIPSDLGDLIAAGKRPRADYFEMAERFGAEIIDHPAARVSAGRLGGIVSRIGGDGVLLAAACWRQRRDCRAVFTDSEQVGMLYALMSHLSGRRRPRHVMIGHRLSPRSKVLFHRLLRLRRGIDHVVVYAAPQRAVAIERLGYRPDQVTLMPFMVDTEFWRPDGLAINERVRPMICAVGQELRDYATLIEAVRGLDVDLVVAAASPWSRRQDAAAGLDVPANVEVSKFDQFDLRQVYAESSFVVVPVKQTDFPAGITTILEAMSMSRATICTRTEGQADTIVDDVTGIYVPPADVGAMRAAIQRLLDDPDEAARLGAAGRQWVRANADIDLYADRLARLVRGDGAE